MIRSGALGLVLAAFALPAYAQRGMMGGMGRGKLGTIAREPGLTVPKYVNAVNLMIEHRQDLALTDSQFTRVIAIKRVLDSTNALSLRRLDSLQRLFKAEPIFSAPSAARRDSLASARSLADMTMADVRENVGTARDKAFALLSVTQLTRAQDLESKAQQAIDEEKQNASRGRSGGGFGRPPG